jgi:hypothetical protein
LSSGHQDNETNSDPDNDCVQRLKEAHHWNTTVVATLMWMCVAMGGACQEPPPAGQRARPDVLIVLPGAADVRDTDENEGTVLYQLNEEFPAQAAINTIRSRLESRGWRPLQEDFLNPGLATSLGRGWTSHEDRTGPRSVRVYEWVGQWEDEAKRIVWYVLTYDAVTSPDGEIRAQGRLRVRATLLSAETAKALREAAAKARVPK